MSGFTGSTGPQSGVGIPQSEQTNIDWRLLADYYRDDPWVVGVDSVDAFTLRGFRTPWWPARASFDSSGGEMLAEVFPVFVPEVSSGAISKMAFTGVTRDANGSILGGCVVKLFKSVDGGLTQPKDVLLDQTISDATTGAFLLLSPYYPDTHYIVSYKVGSPDVAGSTVNTLIGA